MKERKLWIVVAIATFLVILVTPQAFGQEVGDTLTIVVIPTPEAVAPETVFVEADTVYVQLPVEVCPEGWTCTPPAPPPDEVTEPPPIVTGMFVAGYASPDMLEPTENGLHVEWVYPFPADSFRVFGGHDSGGGSWETVVPGGVRIHKEKFTYDFETREFACVTVYLGTFESGNQCDAMNWAPMVRQ